MQILRFSPRFRALAASAAVALLATSPLALAAPQLAGTLGSPPAAVMKVAKGSVSVQRGAAKIPGAVGLALFPADVIVTGADGTVGMTFDDNSLLSLGPSSRYSIDRFEFNRRTYDGAFESTLSKGKLAVISGKIAKQGVDQMQVRTPTSILGVRGTQFVVQADADGEVAK